MKNFKLFMVLIVTMLFVVACSEDELLPSSIHDDLGTPESQTNTFNDQSAQRTALTGTHYNLNIIGVSEKSMNTIAAGHVIFVNLNGVSEIYLQKGDTYAVLDKNGTDADGALLQLPDPGMEPYVTELPLGFDTTTDYSVWARPLGKPLTGSTLTTMADLSLIGENLVTKKEARLWQNIINNYELTELSFTWGDFVPNPVTFERLKGKSSFQNVTAELLTVVYEVYVSYYENDVLVSELFHVRIPIFSELLEGEYWKYDNNGLKLLQVRFYPFGTDVTYDDVANGWD